MPAPAGAGGASAFALFYLPGEEAPLAVDLTTWVLLYHVADDAVRAELSCPAAMSDTQRITVWRERIILPDVPLEPMPDVDAGITPPDDELDVVVVRR